MSLTNDERDRACGALLGQAFRVLVHCVAARQRTPSVAAARWDGDTASATGALQ